MNARLLSLLFFQPLMIERNAWDAILAANDGVRHQRPVITPARACSSCDDPIAAPARYMNVLELLNTGSQLSTTDSQLPADTAIITISGLIVKHAEEWECDILGLTDL